MLSAADFRRSAVLFVRRCGQTRRSCCINQLVSPRAVLVNGALARLFYDVTGDRPTIKRTHKKRNTPIRYAPLKKTLSRRISRPSSAQNGAERNGRAESARLINIGQSERSVLGHAQSKPAPYRARPMRSGRVCGCQAVVPSKSTVIMPNPFRFKYAFIIIACAPAVNGKIEKKASKARPPPPAAHRNENVRRRFASAAAQEKPKSRLGNFSDALRLSRAARQNRAPAFAFHELPPAKKRRDRSSAL